MDYSGRSGPNDALPIITNGEVVMDMRRARNAAFITFMITYPVVLAMFAGFGLGALYRLYCQGG